MNSLDTELQYVAADVATFIESLKKKTGCLVRLKSSYYDVHTDLWMDDNKNCFFLLLGPIMSLPRLTDLYKMGEYDWVHSREIISPEYNNTHSSDRIVVIHTLWNGNITRITCDIDELEVVDDFTPG